MVLAKWTTLGFCFVAGLCFAAPRGPLTTCQQVSDCTDDPRYDATAFALTGTVVRISIHETHHFTLADDTGFAAIEMATNALATGGTLALGDVVTANGRIECAAPVALCTNIVFVRKGAIPDCKTVSGSDVVSGKFDSHIIKVRGVVKHIFLDDIDPQFDFLVLDCDSSVLFVPTQHNNVTNRNLIGATVEVTGRCHPYGNRYRRHIGRTIGPTDITILTPATRDPYDVPDIADIRRQGPAEISSLGRHKARGVVMAVWGDGRALVKTGAGDFVRVEFASSERPVCGQAVEVIGYPASDLYNINLTSAYWKGAEGDAPPTATNAVADVSVRDWQRVHSDHPYFIPSFHGQPVRLRGVVRGLTREPDAVGLLTLETDGSMVQVDATAHPDILQNVEIGCTVSVTGVAVMDIDNWRPNAAFPKIRGFFVVPRSADDLTILSRPPWLTPRRLLTALAVLALVLIAIVIWNRILKSQVERRSRQLLRERTEGIRSKLKADERTRIAVELHDSLSQNLAGVTFELDAACNLTHDRDLMMRHLGIASKALKSCRREMRDCLWDLRNNALGTGSLNEVIHRSLVPIVGQTQIVIRFDALRSRLTDDLIHAILRIVRELVSNAIRHGKATTVRISGCLDGKFVRFSVRDNGIGFGETPPPGTTEGHFGLQGVRERARHFNGDMTISRTPKDETRVAVCLQIPEFDFTD